MLDAPRDTDWDALLNANLEPRPGINTLMKAFQDCVRRLPNKNFLGTRAKNDDGTVGAYEWLTFTEVNNNVSHLARGLKALDLCPDFQAEGRSWRFCGVWARNRQEWMTTLLAGMHYDITNVGFFDAMGVSAVDFVLKQTEMVTLFLEGGLLPKILEMKGKGLATSLKNLVLFDPVQDDLKK